MNKIYLVLTHYSTGDIFERAFESKTDAERYRDELNDEIGDVRSFVKTVNLYPSTEKTTRKKYRIRITEDDNFTINNGTYKYPFVLDCLDQIADLEDINTSSYRFESESHMLVFLNSKGIDITIE